MKHNKYNINYNKVQITNLQPAQFFKLPTPKYKYKNYIHTEQILGKCSITIKNSLKHHASFVKD